MSRNGLWTALALCTATLAAFAAAGCGDDSSSSSAAATNTTTSASTTISSDIDAIEASIKTWLLEGDCSLMTDEFLDEPTFIDEPTTACETFEAGFSPPAYGEDDIEVGDVEYENDKATAVVGGGSEGISVTSGGEEITSTYHLVFEDGTWKIDSAEIN